MRPLAGVRVLDLSRVLAGPVCCQVLGDLGADVVKVEKPGVGDDTRQWGPPFVSDGGPSAYYLACNRNKRGIALDLHHPDARSVLEGLIARADILVENFLPRTLAKLQLTPEYLRVINPRLVVASISGFGRTGPAADTPGYDLAVQALGGLMSITGEPDGMPMKAGVAIADVLTGLYAAVAALAGLHARGEHGDGRAFDLALTDCLLGSLVNVVQGALVTGQRPRRWGNAHSQIVPYEAFATANGHLVLAVGNDQQWQRLCRAARRDDLATEPRYATNPDRVRHREELVAALQAMFRGRTTAAWQTLLSEHDVPHGPVLPVDDALELPSVVERGLVQNVTDVAGHAYRVLGGAIREQGESPAPVTAPPGLGEHTRDVLRDWLGYDEARINALCASGAAATSSSPAP